MKKRNNLILCLIFFTIILVGCSKDDNLEETLLDSEISTQDEITLVPSSIEKVQTEPIKEVLNIENIAVNSDLNLFEEHNFKDFYIILNGKTYTFPLKVQTLLDDGWIIEEANLNVELEPDKKISEISVLNENKERILIEIINFDSENKLSKDSYICSISCFEEVSNSRFKTPDLIIPWGAKLGETKLQEFDDFYTSPTYVYEKPDKTYYYVVREFSEKSTNYSKENSIRYEFKNDVLNYFKVKYYN